MLCLGHWQPLRDDDIMTFNHECLSIELMPPNSPDHPISFGACCLRAILYILFIGALMQGVYYEALYMPEVRFTEYGFTELMQSALLAGSSILLLYTRHALKALPNVTLLLFAFVASSLVREQDYWLDAYVADHTWKVLVALLILPSLYWVIRNRQLFIAEFRHYSSTFSFGLFTAGVLATYVFSRLYGRGEVWIAILGDNYQRTFKDAAEEVTELFGYALILIAVIELVMLVRRWRLSRA